MGPVKVTDVTELGDNIIRKFGNEKLNDKNSKLILLIYGEPGSGKSTYSEKLVQYLNKKYNNDNNNNNYNSNDNKINSSSPIIYTGKGDSQTQICQYNNDNNDNNDNDIQFAVHLKMDGFHIPLNQLSSELKEKRGCYESFDSTLVVKLVELLTNNNNNNNENNNNENNNNENKNWDYLSIPDFDHSIKDPINPGIYINNKSKIIVLEGLYLMLNIEPWCKIPKLVQKLKHFEKDNNSIQIAHIIGGNQQESAYRVGLRHLNSGLVSTYNEGLEKYFANDLNNAKIVENESITDFDDWIIDNSTRQLI